LTDSLLLAAFEMRDSTVLSSHLLRAFVVDEGVEKM
jgi:hypothetical protein